MKNESQIACGITPNQSAAVHDAGNFFQTGGELDVIDGCVNGRECAEHFGRLHAPLERRVVFRIERLRVSHAAGQPEHNQRVRGRFDLLLGLRRKQRSRITRAQRGQRRGAGCFQKITTIRFHGQELLHSV